MNPFLPDEVDVLRVLARAWPTANMVVLGAVAIRCFLPMSWRVTEDFDLTVATDIEHAVAALARLAGWSPDARHEQRWHIATGIAVDLVPASATALESGFIEWPRTGFRMSLLGIPRA